MILFGPVLVISVLIWIVVGQLKGDEMTDRRYVLEEPLDPYRQITEEMLVEKDFETLPPASLGVSTAELKGRFALVALRAGSVLTESELGPHLDPESLSGRSVVSVSLINDGILDAIKRGEEVTLILSPSDLTRDPLLIDSTIVLDWKTKTDKPGDVVLAIPTTDVQGLAQFIGSSKVALAR